MNLGSSDDDWIYDFSPSSVKENKEKFTKKEKKEVKLEIKNPKENLFIHKVENKLKNSFNEHDYLKKIKKNEKKKKLVTLEDQYLEFQLSEVEEQNLWRVFKIFLTIENENNDDDSMSVISKDANEKKKFNKKEEELYFDANDVRLVLKKLGIENISQKKLDEMIWEFDENLDKKIDKREFELMFKKCMKLHVNYENKNNNKKKIFYNPNGIFTLVQFLMFCKPIEDEDGKIKNKNDFIPYIIMEDTYFLIYGRLDRENVPEKRNQLDIEIKKLFGSKEKNEDGTDIKLYFKDYVDKMTKNLLKVINNLNEEKKQINKINNDKFSGFDKKVPPSMSDFIKQRKIISENIKNKFNSRFSKINC